MVSIIFLKRSDTFINFDTVYLSRVVYKGNKELAHKENINIDKGYTDFPVK